MKKNKALYMWAALAAVAIAGAVLDDQWDKHKKQMQATQDQVLHLDAQKVKELELTLENPSAVTLDSVPVMTNRLQLIKSEKGWTLRSPVEELADQNAVEGFIEWVVNEKASTVKTSDPIKWESFGLDKPKGSIQLKDDQGRAYIISVSSRKNFEGMAYLRKDAEEKVLLADAMWFSNIEKTLNDFRDKRILKVRVAEIKRMLFKTSMEKGPATSVIFEKIENVWTLPMKPDWKIDQNRVRELLATLTGPVVLEFKREGAIRPTELKEFNLEKPRANIELELAEGMTWTAEISEPKDAHYFVHVNDPSMIVTLNSDEGGKLTHVVADDYRDRKAPFQLSREKLKSLELTKADKNLKAEKDQAAWQIKEKSEASKADGKEIQGLIERVRNLEVAEFMPSAKDLGAAVKTELSLKDEAGETLFSLSLGSMTKVKAANGVERTLVLAKTNISPEVISLDQDQVVALGLDAMLGDVKEPAAANGTTIEPSASPTAESKEPHEKTR